MTPEQENLRWIYLQTQVVLLQAEDLKRRLERILEKFQDEIKQVPQNEKPSL